MHTRGQNFQQLAAEILANIGDKSLVPTFAFLDPFGYKDTPMALIAELLASRQCELLIYFDANSTHRFSTSGLVDERMAALFGTDEFKVAPASGVPRMEFLRDLYGRQLRDVASFNYVQPFQMNNTKNRVSHHLFFCTRHIRGLSAMKQAMWKLDTTGGYRFESNYAGTPVLFGDLPDLDRLGRELVLGYSGQTVTIERLEDYADTDTGFCRTHVRKALKPMEQDGRVTSSAAKRNTYPKGTQVTFA